MASVCEHSSEPSGSITGRKSLDQLRNYQLLMEDSAPCVKSVMWLALKQLYLKLSVQKL
jgi:hypothetical protein